MKSESKAIVALVISAFLWSTGGILIKLVDWNGFAISGSRSFIASFVLLIYIRKPKFSFSFPQTSAAFASTCTMILYVLANKLTTAANVILLQYTAPVYVAILAWFILKERPTVDNWIALAIISFGMILFFSERLSPGDMTGNILAILSGFGLAFFTVLMRMQKGNSPFESFLLAHIITFVISIPFIVKAGLPDASGWLGIIMLGVFQTGFASVLFSYGIRHVSALKAMLVMTLEPILNPIWVFIFKAEVPGFNAIIGGVFIMAGVLFTSIHSSKRRKLAQ